MAVYKSMPLPEFLELVCSTLPLQEAQVVGFRDSEGVLLSPSLLLNDPDLVKTEEYKLILRDKSVSARPTSGSLRPTEDPLMYIIAEMRGKGSVSDEEYFALLGWVLQKEENVMSAYRTYLVDMDLEALKSRLMILALSQATPGRRHSGTDLQRPVSQRDSERAQLPRDPDRPTTTRSSDRPGGASERMTATRPMSRSMSHGMRRNYDRYMQVIADLESQDILEERMFSVIKTLILRENPEVLHEIDTYFSQGISLVELGHSLMRLSDAQSSYLERPSSPMPRKNELLLLVNSLVKEHLPFSEDIEVLNDLIAQENEFVFSAFDVFESDKDQEELMDSLMRAVTKYKRKPKEQTSAGFYAAPSEEDRKKPRRSFDQLISDLHLSEHLSSELHGTLKCMIRTESRALLSIFERFYETEDGIGLVENLKLVTAYYFQHLMDVNFSRREAKFIKRQLKDGGDFSAAVQVFEVDGQANNFIMTLKQMLQRVGFAVSLHAQDFWAQVLEDLEAEDAESEEESVDLSKSLSLLISRSEQLKPYQGYLNNQLSQENPEILEIARRFSVTENLEDNEKKLLKIVRLIPSHKPSTAGDSDSSQEENILLETIRTQLSDEKVAKFQKLYRDGLESLLGTIEVFKVTGDEADMLETLRIIDNVYEEDEGSEEDHPDAFQAFVRTHFTEDEQSVLLRLQEEGDQRISAAIDMHDISAEARELAETLKFIIKSQEDIKAL